MDVRCPVRPLTKDELLRLKRNNLRLVELIDPTELVGRLFADGCLTRLQWTDIKDEVKTSERNKLLLDIFARCSHVYLERFIALLIDTGQGQIAKMITDDGGNCYNLIESGAVVHTKNKGKYFSEFIN